MIPKRLHQVWIGGPVPLHMAGLAQSWKRHHPDWSYHLWTDTDARPFVASRYPDLLDKYDSYPYVIQRADAIRYLLLDFFGGVYVDLDIECLKPIDPLLADRSMVLVREPPGHEIVELGRCLSNAFMAAGPGHPFLRNIIRAVQSNSQGAVTHRDVSETTGPSMLERASRRSPLSGVHLLEHEVMFPYPRNSAALAVMLRGEPDAVRFKLACIANGAYAIHYWAQSWHNLSGEELFNPNPHKVPGFRFFPGLDSVGSALRNAGRNVPELAKICAGCEAAVAFNTDGFIKSRVEPRRKWERWRDRPANEGLYIKRSALRRPLWRTFGLGR